MAEHPCTLNIAGFCPNSQVNGPGKRFVLWLQGCNLNCIDCINKDLQSFQINKTMSVEEVISEISKAQEKYGIVGLTISGGEPLLQAPLVQELLTRTHRMNLTALLFTGYSKEELEINQRGAWDRADLVVSGRFDKERRSPDRYLTASSNQAVIQNSPINEEATHYDSAVTEIIIDENGAIIITGFPTPDLVNDILGQSK